MADNTLATKYRPKTLEHVYGQPGAVAQIRGFMKTGIPQTILITGATGTGKTTLGRIIAAMANGWEGDPAKTPSLTEFNIGSDTGVDYARDIIKSTHFMPRDGARWRVILLDEVHRLSLAAKSAILKPLEEPPEHVLWILCTDQPEKILESVTGRGNRIRLDALNEEALKKTLLRVYKKENMRFGEKRDFILDKIAAMVGGNGRMSLQLLQTVNNVIVGSKGKFGAKELLKMAIEQTNIYANDQVAVKLLARLYLGKIDKAIATLGDTKDHAGLINNLLELNRYMVEVTSGGQISYRNQPRMQLQEILKKQECTPAAKQAAKIHAALSKAKHWSLNYTMSEFHLLVTAISELYGKEK